MWCVGRGGGSAGHCRLKIFYAWSRLVCVLGRGAGPGLVDRKSSLGSRLVLEDVTGQNMFVYSVH